MRSYNISLAILFCCFAYQLLIEANIQHYNESDPHAYLWRIIGDGSTTNLMIRMDSPVFTPFRDGTAFGGYVTNKSAVSQQSTSSVFTLTAPFTYILRSLDFIVNILWNTTGGFGSFITNFGTPITVVPSYIAVALTIGVFILHAFALYQWLRGGDVRAGA